MYVHGNPHTVFRTELKSAVVLHFTSVGRWFRLGGGGGGGTTMTHTSTSSFNLLHSRLISKLSIINQKSMGVVAPLAPLLPTLIICMISWCHHG